MPPSFGQDLSSGMLMVEVGLNFGHSVTRSEISRKIVNKQIKKHVLKSY